MKTQYNLSKKNRQREHKKRDCSNEQSLLIFSPNEFALEHKSNNTFIKVPEQ